MTDAICSFASPNDNETKEGSDRSVSTNNKQDKEEHIDEDNKQLDMIGNETQLNAIDCDFGPTTKSSNIFSVPPKLNEKKQAKVNMDPDGFWAQFDSGAFVSVIGNKQILHNYQKFTKKHKSPVKLLPTTEGSDATPEEYGYIHILAENAFGFLPVLTFYPPLLCTTVVDERDFIKAAGYKSKDYSRDTIYKDFKHGNCTYKASNKKTTTKDIILHRILVSRKRYTDILILPEPDIISEDLFDDPDIFEEEVNKATIMSIHKYQESEMKLLREELNNVPKNFINFLFMNIFKRILLSGH